MQKSNKNGLDVYEQPKKDNSAEDHPIIKAARARLKK